MFFQLIFEIQNLFQIGLQLWCFNNGKRQIKKLFFAAADHFESSTHE